MIFPEGLELAPIHLVAVSADCNYLTKTEKRWPARFLLPDTSELCAEERFAEVAIGWTNEGIHVDVQIKKAFEKVSYPDLQRGDSVELFIDTRDRKTSGFASRFCHHFFFTAEPIDGRLGGEMTRFRTEDVHALCDPSLLQVQPKVAKGSYSLAIFIPAHCLHGYDPEQFNRLGFTYRINRSGGQSQHFSVLSQDFPIEQQPSLWSSLRLIK